MTARPSAHVLERPTTGNHPIIDRIRSLANLNGQASLIEWQRLCDRLFPQWKNPPCRTHLETFLEHCPSEVYPHLCMRIKEICQCLARKYSYVPGEMHRMHLTVIVINRIDPTHPDLAEDLIDMLCRRTTMPTTIFGGINFMPPEREKKLQKAHPKDKEPAETPPRSKGSSKPYVRPPASARIDRTRRSREKAKKKHLGRHQPPTNSKK